MKNSKSNTKIPVTTKNFLWGIHFTTYQPVFVTYLNSPSTSRYIIMDIVNLPMSWAIVVIRCQTPIWNLPNTKAVHTDYWDIAKYPLRFIHWIGTPRYPGFIARAELRALKVSWISYIVHPAKSRTFPVQDSMLKKLLVVLAVCLPHGWHCRDHLPGHRMFGIGRGYSICEHPFIVVFESIVCTLYSTGCSPHDRIL